MRPRDVEGVGTNTSDRRMRSGIMAALPDHFMIKLMMKDDPAIFGNYRPISILPAISKIFEKVMFNQLHAHF